MKGCVTRVQPAHLDSTRSDQAKLDWTLKDSLFSDLFMHLLLSLLVNISYSHCCYIWLTLTEFRSGAASPKKKLFPRGTLLKKMKVCASHVLSHVLENKKNKGGHVEMPRFGDTVLFSYCVMLFFCSVCSISLSTHWPFATPGVCAVAKQNHSVNTLIYQTNKGSKLTYPNKLQWSCRTVLLLLLLLFLSFGMNPHGIFSGNEMCVIYTYKSHFIFPFYLGLMSPQWQQLGNAMSMEVHVGCCGAQVGGR